MKANRKLLHFIFGQMKKLDKGEINVPKAQAQANLAKQANNALKWELDRDLIDLKKKRK